MKMKAIKDCVWEVYIYKDNDSFYWQAYTTEENCCGIDSILTKFTTIFYTENEAKNHWKCFAKLNNIWKWKYD